MSERFSRREFIIRGAKVGLAVAGGVGFLELVDMYGRPLNTGTQKLSQIIEQPVQPIPKAIPKATFQESLQPAPSIEPKAAYLPNAEPTLKPATSTKSEIAQEQELAKIKPGQVIYTADTHKRIICLTVDDGFNKDNMKKIMEYANKRNVKMSFLPIGTAIAADPGLYRAMIESGHEIYNHTLHHPDLTTLSTQQIKDEILRAREALWKVAKKEIPQNLLRPPGGAFNRRVIQVSRELGYGILMWDVTSAGTSKYATVGKIEKNVENNLHNGAIVLQHPTPFDTAAFPQILDNILSRGYKVVPVSKGL